MKNIHLKDYLADGHTQLEAAKIMGCNQSAISQMLAAGREIIFIVNDDGHVDSFFEKRLPGRKKADQAA